jgi:hypothetical protein
MSYVGMRAYLHAALNLLDLGACKLQVVVSCVLWVVASFVGPHPASSAPSDNSQQKGTARLPACSARQPVGLTQTSFLSRAGAAWARRWKYASPLITPVIRQGRVDLFISHLPDSLLYIVLRPRAHSVLHRHPSSAHCADPAATQIWTVHYQ